MPFRPTFWATVITVPVILVLLGLGTWQLQRLQWKNDLIETRRERIAMPPAELLQVSEDVPVAAFEYRPVRLTGILRKDFAYRLLNRVQDGKQGFHVVSPMELDGSGEIILVDRGWAPRNLLDATWTGEAERADFVGYVRGYTEPGGFLPPNEPANNNWFHMNENQMLASAGMTGGLGFYVEAGPGRANALTYPRGAEPSVELRNSHLEYAVTWYGLAAVLAVIFVVYHWRRRDD